MAVDTSASPTRLAISLTRRSFPFIGRAFRSGRTAALSGDRLDRGEKELRALIASPPPERANATLVRAHHRLGMILEKQGRKEQARAEYNTALSLDPKNENAKKSLAALK